MNGDDHGAGGCCGQCGGAAPKPRLQPLATGDGARPGALGGVAGAAAAGGMAAAPGVGPAVRLGGAEARTRSVFRIPGMDCPSEENLIRMALGGLTGHGHGHDGHAHGDTVGHLIEDHRLRTVGHRRFDFHTTVDRAGVHDQSIGLGQC